MVLSIGWLPRSTSSGSERRQGTQRTAIGNGWRSCVYRSTSVGISCGSGGRAGRPARTPTAPSSDRARSSSATSNSHGGRGSPAAEVVRRARLQLVKLARGRAPVRLEGACLPAGEPGAGLVGALEEREQRPAWVAGRANCVVGEEPERPVA